jgi:2-oxoglutarate ferredoxin oxidoreductase subunit alpha
MVDVLVAMNPAALKTNLGDLIDGGVLIVNQDEFTQAGLKKARYEKSPLEDGSLKKYQLHAVKISSMNRDALKDLEVGAKAADRCKNFFALGLVYWLYGRPMEPTLEWISDKFRKMPDIGAANSKALKAGYYYGETTEAFAVRYEVPQARIEPGLYRKVTGNEALALGFAAAAKLAGKELFLASYPITPASTLLEDLSRFKAHGVKTVQAEDEIAAVTIALGASFAGALALTSTSGPGLALKSEAVSLAATVELPLVIVDIQRGGPSTGLPTKTEQADLGLAVFGRHGECPLPVIAARSPSDCFYAAIEASRIAIQFMTPVILLSDGYLANGAEPWKVPQFESLPRIVVRHPDKANTPQGFRPYLRDEHFSRPWALPGTPGLEHRLGGLEKEDVTGNVSYDPENHQHMVHMRARKVAAVAEVIAPTEVTGDPEGELVVVGWGGTYGSILSAVQICRARGLSVSFVHLRHLSPLPADLGETLRGFQRVLVPELNMGQLRRLLRAEFLLDAEGLNKIKGKPFLVSEVVDKIVQMVGKEVAV